MFATGEPVRFRQECPPGCAFQERVEEVGEGESQTKGTVEESPDGTGVLGFTDGSGRKRN